MKKLFKKKKSLSQRHITKQTKALVDIGKAPIIGVSITIADGATVTTTSKAISLLCEALGEDKTVDWHSKYMDKFDKLTKQCYSDLENMVKEAKDQQLKPEWKEVTL